MSEGQEKFWKLLSRGADLWSLLPESVRSYVPSVVGGGVSWMLNWLGGTSPLESGGIGVCVAILLSLPAVLRYMSRSGPSESMSVDSGTLLRDRASVLRLGASQIVGLLVVASLIYSLYLQSQLREIQKELRCIILPRHLTADQQAEIAARLRKHKPYEITLKIPVFDGEIARYASEFERAFTEGKWRVKREFPPLPTDNTFPKQSTELVYMTNPETLRKYDEWHDPVHPHPGQVMSDVLIGLRVVGASGGGTDSKIEEGVYQIALTVGVKPYSWCE